MESALAVTLDALRAQALVKTLRAMGTVEAANVDATWPAAAAAILAVVNSTGTAAANAVEQHMGSVLTRAVGTDLNWDLSGLVAPAIDSRRAAAGLAATPGLVAARVAGGMDPTAALAPSVRWSLEMAGSQAHETGRQGVAEATTALPGFSGWRWVPEGGACPWCLMQASRGAVFKQSTVRHSHAHCRCGAAEVVDRAEAHRIAADGREMWAQMNHGDLTPAEAHAQFAAALQERELLRMLGSVPANSRLGMWQRAAIDQLRQRSRGLTKAAASLLSLPMVARMSLMLVGSGSPDPNQASPVRPDGTPARGHSRDLPERADIPASDLYPDSPTATGPGSPMSVRLPGEPTTPEQYAAMWAAVPTSQWGAADLGMATRLPDGRIVWLFGDTFSGSNGFVHSTGVVQTGGDLHVSQGGAQLLPNDDASTIYWITGATVGADGHLEVTAAQMRIGRTGPWDFHRLAAQDRVAAVTVSPEGDLQFAGWQGWRSVPEWPAPMHVIGPHHFTYAHRVHRSIPLGGGWYLTSDAQNWDDDPRLHRNPDGSLRYSDFGLIFGRTRLH